MGFWNTYSRIMGADYDRKPTDGTAAESPKLSGIELADYEWERSRAAHQAKLDDEVLGGPAGEYLWGTVPDSLRPSEAMKAAGSVKDQFRASFRDLKETATGLADPKRLLNVGSEFGKDIGDPAERSAVVEAERAARDAARRPYLAPARVTPRITRIATRGSSQFEEIASHLAQSGLAGRPDLVYGVYRVPDRLDHKMPGSEASRVVEWDIVHTATAALPPTAPPARMRFDGEARWVRRRKGEPTVLDEDLALSWMAAVGIPPECCLGIAREVVMQSSDGWFGESDLSSESADFFGRVLGVSVFHTAGAAPAPNGPVEVPFDGVAGTHVEVLNWAAVARAVHPRRQRTPETPSPFPYLPATPQEVLMAYLQIVGVSPADCFGAAVTIDRFTQYAEKTGRTEGNVSMATLKPTDGVKLPCADGTLRRRLHGGSLVVVSYRDTPAYREGRERWHAYQHDVLFARMHQKTGARRLIGDGYENMGVFGSVLRTVEQVGDVVNRVTNLRSKDPAHVRLADQARYCEPLS